MPVVLGQDAAEIPLADDKRVIHVLPAKRSCEPLGE